MNTLVIMTAAQKSAITSIEAADKASALSIAESNLKDAKRVLASAEAIYIVARAEASIAAKAAAADAKEAVDASEVNAMEIPRITIRVIVVKIAIIVSRYSAKAWKVIW